MAITDALIIMGVFGGMGYIIFAKITKNNPAAGRKIKEFLSGGIYKPSVPVIPNKIEEATMM